METVGVEPTPPSLQARRSSCLSYIPKREWSECGRVESNHHSARRQGYSLLSSPVLSVRVQGGRPTGFEPVPRGSRPRMLPLHHSHHVSGDDRTRTGGLSPDKRALSL